MVAAAPSIEAKLREFVAAHGAWTNHNIDLGGGVSTMGRRPARENEGLRRIVQVVSDLAGRPLSRLRILDLGCGEGIYAIEFARHGAEVVGIEGREANLLKARFVQQALQLDRLRFEQDDVRNLSAARHGRFDVVLCIGLLYHLEDEGALGLLANMAAVCDRLAIVSTLVSVDPVRSSTREGRQYWGREFLEHLAHEDKGRALWASLDNERSYWLTRPSLLNALTDVGFTSAYECRAPHIPLEPADLGTFVALKGEPAKLYSAPPLDEVALSRIPERPSRRVHPGQKPYYPALRLVAARLPQGIKGRLKRFLRRGGLWWAAPRESPK